MCPLPRLRTCVTKSGKPPSSQLRKGWGSLLGSPLYEMLKSSLHGVCVWGCVRACVCSGGDEGGNGVGWKPANTLPALPELKDSRAPLPMKGGTPQAAVPPPSPTTPHSSPASPARSKTPAAPEDSPVALRHLLQRLVAPVLFHRHVPALILVGLQRAGLAALAVRRALLLPRLAAQRAKQLRLLLGSLLLLLPAVDAGAETAPKQQVGLVQVLVQRVLIPGGVLLGIPIKHKPKALCRLDRLLLLCMEWGCVRRGRDRKGDGLWQGPQRAAGGGQACAGEHQHPGGGVTACALSASSGRRYGCTAGRRTRMPLQLASLPVPRYCCLMCSSSFSLARA